MLNSTEMQYHFYWKTSWKALWLWWPRGRLWMVCCRSFVISDGHTHIDKAIPHHTHQMGASIPQRLSKIIVHRFGQTGHSVQSVTERSKRWSKLNAPLLSLFTFSPSEFTMRFVPPVTLPPRGCFEGGAQTTSALPPIKCSSLCLPLMTPLSRWEALY